MTSYMYRVKAGFIFTAVACSLAIAQPFLRAQQTAARTVVVLDAAHGGDDSGARLASGQDEKSVTLALSVRLRSLLAARGLAVVTTRESDKPVTPDQRAAIANHANASLCLILHASESGAGIHLFTSALAPQPPSQFPAWKTAQSAYVTRSLALAGTLNSALTQTGLTVMLGRAGLPGMDSMTCPAVAIEIAPDRASGGAVQSEPDDTAYDARIATAIAAAVVQWTAEAHQP
ncbi:MAG: N-acetylmuramoyl-L-alanine amidase [Acidobacteriota bacterium]|nr:N-acetylmuramoyl-L-alanine amidase [Acidobacteriota bacterium]